MAINEGGPDPDIKERARELRRQGLSVSQIAAQLRLRSPSPVRRWVADIPAPAWTRRPRAKDDLRCRARQLRAGGSSLREIAIELGVAKSSVSLWVRDMPVPEGLRERAAHAHRINGERWLRDRARREAERQEVKAVARAFVGPLSDRELTLVGAALYWAEGAKDKPYARREKVALINSDSEVIILFQRWLDLMSVPEEDRRYRLSIHESADLESAHVWWSQVTGVPIDRFDRPTLKRHNPRTVRLNVGAGYHGCLVISVCKSRVLYQQIDGLFKGLVAGVTALSSAAEVPPTTG
jgi:transcriptional regulator with XRE-family HTH domain